MNKLFSRLYWHESTCSLNSPLFTPKELSSNTSKWLKHLLLVRVGLRKSHELNAEIRRFSMSGDGIKQAEAICTQLLTNITPNSTLIIIKIILPNKTMNLPNYRIKTLEQIEPIICDIKSKYYNIANELWVCQSSTSQLNSNLGGRISIPLEESILYEVIEIIWHTSPRLLDEYQTIGHPYLHAKRICGMLAFSIDALSIPDKINYIHIKQQLLRDFSSVSSELYHLREQIEILADILKRSGAKQMVLEFKMDEGYFKFIDWDTDIEAKEMLQL